MPRTRLILFDVDHTLDDISTSMLRQMLEMHVFEQALYHALLSENVPGTIHQSTGQEAVAAGVGHAQRPDDLTTSTHRGHAHAIYSPCSLRHGCIQPVKSSSTEPDGASSSARCDRHISLAHLWMNSKIVALSLLPRQFHRNSKL